MTKRKFTHNPNPAIDYEKVKEIFASNGCELLSTEYKNNKQKLDYKCSCGRVSTIAYNNFIRGRRCRQCRTDKQRYSLEEIQDLLSQGGCKLVSDDYKNKNTKIKFICKCGKTATKVISQLQYKFIGCRSCGIKSKSGENHPDWQPDKDSLKLKLKIASFSNVKLRSYLENKHPYTKQQSVDKIGYDAETFRKHMESHPNYQQIQGKVSIDHIFPISAFVYHGITDLKIINHLSNLQQMEFKANVSKGDKYDKNAFYNWLDSIGYKDYERKDNE